MVVDLSWMLQVDVLLNMMGHNWWCISVRSLINCFRFNLDWFFFRLEAGCRCYNGQCIVQCDISIRLMVLMRMMVVMVMMILQMRIVHRIHGAHLDVLIKITDICQFLLTDVALINDIIGSGGRWQNNILSVLSILLLMCQNVLLQVWLLRVGLQANVASIRTNSLHEFNFFVTKKEKNFGIKIMIYLSRTRYLTKWIISCFFRFARCANALSHDLHLNGFKRKVGIIS